MEGKSFHANQNGSEWLHALSNYGYVLLANLWDRYSESNIGGSDVVTGKHHITNTKHPLNYFSNLKLFRYI